MTRQIRIVNGVKKLYDDSVYKLNPMLFFSKMVFSPGLKKLIS